MYDAKPNAAGMLMKQSNGIHRVRYPHVAPDTATQATKCGRTTLTQNRLSDAVAESPVKIQLHLFVDGALANDPDVKHEGSFLPVNLPAFRQT